MKNKFDEELQFLETSTADVKQKIYNKTVRQKKKWKGSHPVFQLAALVVLAVSAFLLASNLMEQERAENPMPLGYPVIDQRTIDIMTYENFYNSSTFQSSFNASYRALNDSLSMYALFYHLQEEGYEWTAESEALARQSIERAWQYDYKDEELQAYYAKMFEELDITEEEYIEHYLYLIKKHGTMYDNMFRMGVGLDKDGAYPSGRAFDTYIETAGYSMDELNTMAEKVMERPEPVDPQPDLPFLEDVELEAPKLAVNEEGDYIFVNPESVFSDLAFTPHNDLLYLLESQQVYKSLTRTTLEDYKQALSAITSDDPNYETAQELLDIFVILERTIEKDLKK